MLCGCENSGPFADSLSVCVSFVGACFLFVWSGVAFSRSRSRRFFVVGGWPHWEAAAAEGLGFGSFVLDVVALAGVESSGFSRQCSIHYMF